MLVGARNRSMVAELERLRDVGDIRSLSFVPQGDRSPTAIFVGVGSMSGLRTAAERIGASPRANVRLEYKDALVPLDKVLAAALSEYTSSGIQALRLNVTTLRFEPCEVRFGNWVPGCFEQMSYGIHKFLFVDDARRLHNTDRWVAVHAELNRISRAGGPARNPLAWSPESQSLFCDARAQLPSMWARAAVMCTGLLPIRRSEGDGHFVDEFRGVHDTTYRRIAQTLRYPAQRATDRRAG
ncbi:MAG: hypothetical protein ACLQCU_04810 [Acidimicrobiales bacterium]